MTREQSATLCSTPKTDAECRVTVGYDRQYQSLYVSADFARKLERELEEAQRLIKNLAPTGRYNGLDIEGWYQEAQRYRKGMENWKATAEAKDAAMLPPSATSRAEWISIEDRLPVPYHTVLIGRHDVLVSPITAFWTGEKWCKDVREGTYHPTHWMELPEQPR